VLTPIFDLTFSEFSFGLRPGRSAHDAINLARGSIEKDKRVSALDAARDRDTLLGAQSAASRNLTTESKARGRVAGALRSGGALATLAHRGLHRAFSVVSRPLFSTIHPRRRSVSTSLR
jgi:hypothetical protein